MYMEKEVEIRSYLVKNIANIRHYLKYTQKEMAKMLDISLSKYKRLESNELSFLIDILMKIRTLFNIELDDIILKELNVEEINFSNLLLNKGKLMCFFNKNLRMIRKNKNYSLPEMAEHLNLTLFQYRHLEYGDVQPSIQTLIKVSKNLNISIDDLLIKQF